MPFSALAICNAALRLVEQSTITDFTTTAAGRVCADLYPMIREDLLTRWHWSFTIQKRQLARLTAAPIAHWSHAFQVPSDALGAHVMAVYGTSSTNALPLDHDSQWRRQSDQILSDETELWADIQVDPGEGSYPPPFVSLLVRALAASLAVPMMGRGGEASRAFHHAVAFGTGERELGGLMRLAIRHDRKDRPTKVTFERSLIDAKFRGL